MCIVMRGSVMECPDQVGTAPLLKASIHSQVGVLLSDCSCSTVLSRRRDIRRARPVRNFSAEIIAPVTVLTRKDRARRLALKSQTEARETVRLRLLRMIVDLPH